MSNNIESILTLFSKQQFNEALDAIQELIVNDPNEALLFNIQGACYAGLSKFNLAKESYMEAIVLNPEYAKAHYNLAGALHELDEFEASIQSYQNALVIESDYAEAHNNLGNIFKETGQLDAAIKSYERAISIKPNYVESHYSLGSSLYESGKLEETVKCYERVIELRPSFKEMHNNLGNVLKELGRSDDAVLSYNEAILIDPNFVEVYFNLGTTFQELNQLENAVKQYKKAIDIKPNYPEAHNNLGVAFKELKEFESAIKAYQMAINIMPDYAEAHNNIGIVYKELGQLDDAIKSHEVALNILPMYAEAHNNLGIMLIEGKQLNEAIERFKKAIAADPKFVEAYNNLGSAHMELNDFDLSLKNFQKALSIDPNYAEAHNNLGILFMDLGQLDEAVECFQKAIKTNSNYAFALNNLGIVCNRLNNFDESEECFKKAININPDYFDAYCNFANLLNDLGNFDKALANYERAYELDPNADYMLGNILHAKMHICAWDNYSNQLLDLQNKINDGKRMISPFALMALIDDPKLQKKTNQIYVQDKYPKSRVLPKIDNYTKHKKIRLGYISGDFREHPVSSLTAELYEVHDRSKFEVYAFSYGPNTQDEMNLRIKAGVDHFHDVRKMSHKDTAMLVRKLEIDIVIDLGGFTANSRTGIFTMRAAPIQVSYIGYLGTMGASYYDYLIADYELIPEDSQQHYEEKIVYLPSYQVNDSKATLPEIVFTRKDLGLPEKSFVFCCFNNVYKITPNVFDSWAKILKSVEDSVLFIFVENESAKANLIKEIMKRGIDPKRLIFAERLSRLEHIARYRLVDLFLDTHPCNAGATASDALRMGLPILTLRGMSFPSRVGSSLLNSINLPELITTTYEEYVSLAIELATHPKNLKVIKEKLINNLSSTPLFNTLLFAKNFESACQIIYKNYHLGLDNDHIQIEEISE